MYKEKTRDTYNVIQYISETWNNLTINFIDSYQNYYNSKVSNNGNITPTIMISEKENIQKIIDRVNSSFDQKHKMKVLCINQDFNKINSNHLLYLPYPYISPGGRFNEMYGWDSFFIIIGLLKMKRLNSALNMINNLFYQVEHYGKVLNANRAYYIGRSQPPLLSQSAIEIYKYNKCKVFLENSLKYILKDYEYWSHGGHFVSEIGLSRYYSSSSSKLPDTEEGYYESVIKKYKEMSDLNEDISKYYDKNSNTLTSNFYQADRAVRESGFDLSNKFGLFGADIQDYIPVSLNSLLFLTEKNLAYIFEILDQEPEKSFWENRASHRKTLINKYCWNEDDGLYYDYNFIKKEQRKYTYATTIYPLYVGISSANQANKVINNIGLLEHNGGIMASPYQTGMQWDSPIGWAPDQYFTVCSLQKYGYDIDAKRIAQKYLSMITNDFKKNNYIYEKYNMESCSSNVDDIIKYGYKENAIGFGWTNAVYLFFIDKYSDYQL